MSNRPDMVEVPAVIDELESDAVQLLEDVELSVVEDNQTSPEDDVVLT